MNQSAPAQLVAILGRGVVAPETAVVTGDDLGLTRGDGCFDALRVTNDSDGLRVHHRAPHMARLGRSAALLQISDAPATSAWNELIDEALAEWNEPGEAVLKLVLTRGAESTRSAPFGYLTLTTVPDYSRPRRGVTAVSLDRGYRSDAFADAPWLLGGVKTLSYAVNVAARREALARGVDEPIWRSSDGYLLEGPTSGLIFATDDRLWTTPVAGTGILASVTVAAIFDEAGGQRVGTGEALFTPAQAIDCTGVWLVSAIRGVLP
ncbi:MAG: aminotransferase class IV, partial [Propionibacteriaceae bacterium]|nr:aminotransferase class IV [Propionibacteriaceae bacterium]